MCAREAKEISSEPADQDPPQEVRLWSSTCSQLDQSHQGLHRPHTTVCPGCGMWTLTVLCYDLTAAKVQLQIPVFIMFLHFDIYVSLFCQYALLKIVLYHNEHIKGSSWDLIKTNFS